MANLHKAEWWEKKGDIILCYLCPRYCEIGNDQHGFCYVRKNIDGELYSIGYGSPSGFAIDPIEKKPLFHFHPTSGILSFGTAGCNMGCRFCQNWTTSKAEMDEQRSGSASPEDIVRIAKENNVSAIAYTYNEPTIIGEYVLDVSSRAAEEGIKSVMVTNGYIDPRAREAVYKNIDAANVDLKAFTGEFYKKLTASELQPVLDTLKWLKNDTDVWVELTTLIIPDENDSEEEIKKMTDWVLDNLGDDIPMHFTAFHPDFKMRDKPPTPPGTLKQAKKTAEENGIKYAYLGNIMDEEGSSTYCPNCGELLIKRNWHSVNIVNLESGRCARCSAVIDGVFD